MSKWNSRKLLFSMTVVILNAGLLALGMLPAVVYGGIVGATITGYLVSNVSQKVMVK